MAELIAVAKRQDLYHEVLSIDIITDLVDEIPGVVRLPDRSIAPRHFAVKWRADMGRAGLAEALRRLADRIG